MYFKNNEDGITALTWWRERCLEWCYARAEDGKFGDQKYLDDWTTRFKGVHVLQHRGGGVAPWNVQQFDIAKENNSMILVDKKSGKHYPLVFYHFHGVKFYTGSFVSCCAPVYDISSVAKEWIYIPYFKKLKKVEAQLKLQGISFNTNGAKNPAPGKLHVFLEYAKERLVLWKIGNIRPWQLKLFSFSKQYHFYKLDLLNTETNGPTDRP